MGAPQGIALFPGIDPNSVISAEYTLQHGITPGICTMQIAPPGRRLRTAPGSLEFQYGAIRIRFPNAKIQASQWLANENEQRVQVTIFDRRWAWKGRPISGHYNQRRDNGSLINDILIKETERTPQQLAKLCLDAMSEQGYDVSQLPNTLRPEVNWDYTEAAAALQDLCDMLGCRIVLGLDNRVRLQRAGVGGRLPQGGETDVSDVIDPPNRPHFISVVGAPTRYQADFILEAVGLDYDGKIRPINSLAYKPSGGWGFEELASFAGSFSLRADLARFKANAQASLYKWYRIQRLVTAVPLFGAGPGGLSVLAAIGIVPGYGPVLNLEQLLPIEDEQVELTLEAKILGDNSPTTGRNKPAEVWGAFYPGRDSLTNSLGKAPGDTIVVPLNPIDLGTGMTQVSRYHRGFSIDREHGVVKFAEPVYLYEQTTVGFKRVPADLRLRCAFSIKDGTHQYVRNVESRTLNNGVRGLSRYEVHNDMQLAVYPKTGGSLQAVTNKADVQKQAKFYLDAIEQEYQSVEPETATYAGLRTAGIDGAIQSITWRVGPQGATTSVSRNDERTNGNIPLYKQRRAKEKAAATLDSLRLANSVVRLGKQLARAAGIAGQ